MELVQEQPHMAEIRMKDILVQQLKKHHIKVHRHMVDQVPPMELDQHLMEILELDQLPMVLLELLLMALEEQEHITLVDHLLVLI